MKNVGLNNQVTGFLTLILGQLFCPSILFAEVWSCSEIVSPRIGNSVSFEKINETQFVVKPEEIEAQWEIYDILSDSSLVTYLKKTLSRHQIAILILNKEEESAILMEFDRFDGMSQNKKFVCDVKLRK